MLSRGSIQFYINGPPPIARSTGPPSLVNLINSQNPPSQTDNFYKDTSQENSEEHKELNSLVNKTHNALLVVRSMRIFDLFPDKLIIDENKVSFIYNDAFGVKSIHSVLIENITYVEAQISFIRGSLIVADSSNYRHPIQLKISNLRKESAIRARKLIQGLVHAKIFRVDCSQFTPYDLENNLEELGRVTGED